MSPQASDPLKVLCVDDNEMVATALSRRIREEPGIAWAGVVMEGAAAYEQVRMILPDIVLMDIDMPGVDSFSIVEHIAADLPGVRVVMFSGHLNPAYIERAMDAGAWGYLSKNEDVARLIEAIRSVGRGEFALSEDVKAVQRSGLTAKK